MSHRTSLLARVVGAAAIVGGAYAVWTSSALAAAQNGGSLALLGLASQHSGATFAGGLSGALGRDLALPRLLASQPLIWLGVALVLAPGIYKRLSRRASASEPPSGRAYVECPECRHIVPMSANRCPLCSAEIFSPWSNGSVVSGGSRPSAARTTTTPAKTPSAF